MKQVPGQRKLRAEYLRRRRELRVELWLGTVVFAFLIGVITLCGSILYIPYARGKLPLADLIVYVSLIGVLLLFPVAAVIRWCWGAMKTALKAMARLPYVPPIAPDAVPADEILVRGSEEPPVAQSAVLLRVVPDQTVAKEELLRSTTE